MALVAFLFFMFASDLPQSENDFAFHRVLWFLRPFSGLYVPSIITHMTLPTMNTRKFFGRTASFIVGSIFRALA